MKVLSVKIGASSDIRIVGLEDGSSFFIRKYYLPDALPLFDIIEPARELSDDEYLLLKNIDAYGKTEHIALRLIARAEQYSEGLRFKLLTRGCNESTIPLVFDFLKSEGLLDDKRYAEIWLRQRLRKGNEGKLLLKSRMLNKGLSTEIVMYVLDTVFAEEIEKTALLNYLTKNAMNLESLNAIDRNMLFKQGFSSQILRKVIEEQT